MNYILVEKDNPTHYELLMKLMLEYVAETDQHLNTTTSQNIIPKITKSMVDKEGDKGLIRPNWGYIMEFYICPSHRRHGVGRKMVNQCEKFFVTRGANNVWLTADAVTGIPFWVACDYCDSNEVSPENNQKIFVKQLNLP